jgi:hypothetical protein
MERYNWKVLNNQQVGAFTEYFVKMELTMFGFQVFTTEVDDRGIDFVARFEKGPFLEIQVKSVRDSKYVFMQKDKFQIADNLYLALGILKQDNPPMLYLIPSTAWSDIKPGDKTFVDREYVGKKSKPEWGINLSSKNLPGLERFQFERAIQSLVRGD